MTGRQKEIILQKEGPVWNSKSQKWEAYTKKKSYSERMLDRAPSIQVTRQVVSRYLTADNPDSADVLDFKAHAKTFQTALFCPQVIDFASQMLHDSAYLGREHEIPVCSEPPITEALAGMSWRVLWRIMWLHESHVKEATDILIEMFKACFRKEFQNIKKFSVVKLDDVMTIADVATDCERDLSEDIRIIYIAHVMGVTFTDRCREFLDEIEDGCYEDDCPKDQFGKGCLIDLDDDELAGQCDPQILDKWKKALKEKGSFFRNKVLELYKIASTFYDPGRAGSIINLALSFFIGETGALLMAAAETRYREEGQEPSDETIFLAAFILATEIVQQQSTLVVGDLFDIIDTPFDHEDVGLALSRSIQGTDTYLSMEQKGPDGEGHGKEDAPDDKIIEELRMEKAGLEETKEKQARKINDLSVLLDGAKAETKRMAKKEEEYKEEIDKLKMQIAELQDRLEELEQKGQEGDKEAELEMMKNEIADRSIIMVGGHDNWINQLKTLFPKWKCYGAERMGTVDKSILKDAELVYFFTSYSSHPFGKRVKNYCQSNEVPYRFINGTTNINTTIRRIYEDLTGERS